MLQPGLVNETLPATDGDAALEFRHEAWCSYSVTVVRWAWRLWVWPCMSNLFAHSLWLIFLVLRFVMVFC